MEKKDYHLLIVLVVVIGLFIGNTVVIKQVQTPLMSEILRQQDQMYKALVRMENRLAYLQEAGIQKELQSILTYQRTFSERLAGIESNFLGLRNVLGKQEGTVGVDTLKRKPEAPKPADDVVRDIPVGNSVVMGPKDAAVTIVEFMDFQCPYCKRFHFPMMEAAAAFPEDVNVIVKHFPLSFHNQATPAAKAALAAAEQGQFQAMTTKILENSRALSEEKLVEIAKEIGLDVGKFKKDLEKNDQKYSDIIEQDKALAGNIGVRGTPTYFINGKILRARDTVGIKSEIEKVLSEKGQKDILKADE